MTAQEQLRNPQLRRHIDRVADKVGTLRRAVRIVRKALFDEFEEARTAEAKFAHAMDNLQPLILNNANEGGDWKEHGVHASTVYGRQQKTRAGSEKLYEVTDRIIRENIRKGNLPE